MDGYMHNNGFLSQKVMSSALRNFTVLLLIASNGTFWPQNALSTVQKADI